MTILKATYLDYNDCYFKGNLPDDLKVVWSKTLPRGVAGDYEDNRIRIHHSLKVFAPIWKETLLHEMAHVATDLEVAEHGWRWKKEMRRLYRAGAFEGLL